MLCLSGFELYSRWVPLKPLFNKVLDITRDFVYPSRSKMGGKEPPNDNTFFFSQILPVP